MKNINDLDHVDAETLAAIDEGLRDIEAGRVVPEEEVRELLKKWISAHEEKRKKKRRRDNC
jgi:predicted transcriptional regulator